MRAHSVHLRTGGGGLCHAGPAAAHLREGPSPVRPPGAGGQHGDGWPYGHLLTVFCRASPCGACRQNARLPAWRTYFRSPAALRCRSPADAGIHPGRQAYCCREHSTAAGAGRMAVWPPAGQTVRQCKKGMCDADRPCPDASFGTGARTYSPETASRCWLRSLPTWHWLLLS